MGKKKKVGKERIDKYYKLAKTAGYRARSAFKLIQIAQKFNVFKNANILIDLCAAPGGWLQVAYKNMSKQSTIIGVDLVPIRKIDDNVITIKSDITTSDCIKKIKNIIKMDKADVILNDGAPNVGTTYSYDSFNQNVLVLNSIKIAYIFLKKNGIFITKVFRNEEYISLIWVLEKLFGDVKHIKPRSSREISSEIYLVGLNFLGKKVDKKLFDYTYIFSDQFKKNSNKSSLLETKQESYLDNNENYFSDEESNDEEKVGEKIDKKKKKGLSTILKEKKKKNRQGYDVGDDYRATDICTFIKSDNYVDLLIKNNKFTFDKNYKNNSDPMIKTIYECIYKNECTTKEIFFLCNDLKVLGKSDLYNLIKWRYKIKKSVLNQTSKKNNLDFDNHDVEQTTQELSDVKESSQIDDFNTIVDKNISENELDNTSDEATEKDEKDQVDEIEEFSAYIEKKKKKEQKKKEKKLKKELEKKKKSNRGHQLDFDENEIHFNKDILKLLNKQKFEDHLKILNNDQKDDLEIDHYEDTSSETEKLEHLNQLKNSDLDKLEYLVDLDYEKQKMKEKKLNEEKSNEKLSRRKRAMDFKNEELMKIQKMMELKNEQLLMEKKLREYLSDEDDDEDDDDDDDDDKEQEPKQQSDKHGDHQYDNKKSNSDNDVDSLETTQDIFKENKHIKSMVDKIIRLRRSVKNEEEKSNVNHFFDQNIFSNIFSQLDEEDIDAEFDSHIKNKKNVQKKDDSDKDGSISNDDNESIKEIDEHNLPKIPLPDKLAKKEKKKKLKEKYGNNEVKMKNSSFSIVKTDENAQNLNNYFSNLVKDEDELAFIKCIGEKLIHKKSRMDLIDDSFNRYSYMEDESNLPDWFLEEEKKYRRPVIPIDKKILDEYKGKINKITKMPIKKVIEAKMRNRKREITKMKKLEAKIGKIEKNEDDPFLKQKAITNLLKKNKSDKKRDKSYIVCTGKGSKMAKKKKNKKGKTMVKYVDKRLKKDKKAKKRIEKKKKNISRTKYSKSKPFKFRRKI
ncbi:ribosomal RNA large subunit methyltransferase J [Plasmodium falciparum NF135/5.C10]|uniref:Putative rRNA methyltransferase n=2 Tax=Plasmodium falciparum TaxID=5833 RepID=A0A024V1A8_PLAFA|nr:ribosomal RNA large subunit methyltransferase J [Plasmodium falciparum Vietnam Oak-Knoll (FVO)]ETW40693.1 ribosomal RNA large subunit methyltransferase J [Plasmodium falciparum NF135/5.C10]